MVSGVGLRFTPKRPAVRDTAAAAEVMGLAVGLGGFDRRPRGCDAGGTLCRPRRDSNASIALDGRVFYDLRRENLIAHAAHEFGADGPPFVSSASLSHAGS